ncbi:unnamed protein product [Echinostoma caproni]|uniref:Uncharacterized protein n=1 Tax=Echinostoma caproni TaxID=27848 RepID=A0A183AKJ3_9TREM|nr:unnamed protein product [Echinostoma caproni]
MPLDDDQRHSQKPPPPPLPPPPKATSDRAVLTSSNATTTTGGERRKRDASAWTHACALEHTRAQTRPCEVTTAEHGVVSTSICGSVMTFEPGCEETDSVVSMANQSIDGKFSRELIKKRRLTSSSNISGTAIKKGRMFPSDDTWTLDPVDSTTEHESSSTGQLSDRTTACWNTAELGSTIVSASSPSTGSPISAHSQISPESTHVESHGIEQSGMTERKPKSTAFSIDSIMGKTTPDELSEHPENHGLTNIIANISHVQLESPGGIVVI